MDNFIAIVTNLPSQAAALIHQNQAGPVLAVAVVLILELAWCFFGYKAMKVFATITGFFIGASVGLVVNQLFSLTGIAAILVPVLIGIVLALIGFFIYKAGIFIAVLLTVSYVVRDVLISNSDLNLDETTVAIVAVVVGLAFAILTMVFFRTMLIISSSVAGGFGFASVLLNNMIQIRWDSSAEIITRCAIGVVLALIGVIYQFRTTGKG